MKKFFISIAILCYSLTAFCQNPQLLKDVVPGNNSGTIRQIVKTSNYTFFNENDGGAATDRSLYRTDGTTGGTIKLDLTYPGYISTKAEKLTALGNKVIFSGDNAAYYGEIWSSDGTQTGTVAIERFQPTVNTLAPVYELAEMNGYVYYGVTATNNKTQIRRTDGTVGGTSLVYEFSSYLTAPQTGLFKVINGILYFNLYDAGGTGFDQLWRCDGTAAGTYLLKDFGLDQYVASWYMPANSGIFYWIIVKPGTGNVLWKSDGTLAGTISVITIGTTGNNNYPQFAATIGDNIAFAGLDGNGKELWTTDGTAGGTSMVADINPGAASSNPSGLIFMNNRVYFSATKADSGTELWESDGSAAGTVLVKDINPGVANSNPNSFVLSNNTILFRATTANEGSELWLTDGTAVNTAIVADINPGINSSNPNIFTPGNPVYFAATNGTSGFEVFKYDNSGGVLGVKKVWLTGAAFGGWTEAGVIKLTNNGGGIFTATNIQIIGTGGESSYFKFTEGTWASVAGRSLTTPAPGFPTGVTELSSVTEPQGVDNVITGTPGYWNVTYNYITKAYSFVPTPANNWGVVGDATPNNWVGPDMPLTYDAISNKWSAVVSLNSGFIKFRNNNNWNVNYGDNGADGSLETNGADIAITAGRYLITLDFNTLKYTIKSAFYVNDNSQSGDVFTTAIGNNVNQGTPTAPFATLAYAISQVQAGSTIFVDAGTYTPTVGGEVINKSVTILGANYLISPNDAADPLLANNNRNAETIIVSNSLVIGANNINIEGMTFDPQTNIAIKQTNNLLGFDYVKIANNIFRIKSSERPIWIYGKFQMPLITFDCYITDNRFIKEASGNNIAIIVGAINNVQVLNNTFTVSTDSANRTLTDMYFGDYRIDNLRVSNNTAYRQNVFLNSISSKMATIDFNKVIESFRFTITINFLADPCELNITDNNITDSKSTGGPVISYVRNNGIDVSSPNIVRIERNTINQNVTGLTSFPQALIAPTLDNATQNSQVFIRDNKLKYTGDLSSLSPTNATVSGIRFLNNSRQAVVERNEIEFNVTNYNPNNKYGILILHTGLQPGTNFDFLNNKISGFPNSVAIIGSTGFGGLPAGVTVNVYNNSFTGDLMSINNGTESQEVLASCNWYGSVSAQDFINKITSTTVNISPWLSNGTDNDVATGFQPIPNSCDGNPTLITLDNHADVTCNGLVNGSIAITTTGGKTPFNYTWTKDNDTNFVSHDEDPSGLAPGTYHLALVDGNGSILYITDPQADGPGTIDVTITEPLLLTVSVDGTNNLCNGQSNGTAYVDAEGVSGGTVPYTYLWNNGAITDEISNLAAGTYSVTVTDFNNCTVMASYKVTEPTLLTASITNNSTACSNIANVTALDGTPGYTYLWNNGATSTSINNVPVGNYTVTVTDNNGCSTNASITLTVGEAFNPSASVTDVSCFGGSNGSITVTNANGTAPFTFSKDGINFIAGTLPFSFNNLSAGIYNIAVKDSNGCAGFVTESVAQPTELTATIITVQPTCSGQSTGAISVATAGGSGALKYSWTGTVYTSSQKNISGLATGNYTLTVTDNNGCITSLNVIVPTYNTINVSAVVTNVLCRGSLTGKINLSVSGGSGVFAYSWTGSITAISKDISNLGAGTNYNVTITDIGSGCTVTKSYVIIQPASNLSLAAGKTNATGCRGGTITATASGGSPLYTYSIDGTNFQDSNIFAGLLAGSFTVWVKDMNGCTSSKVVAITDNGSDEYESNNSKSQAKLITVGATINARIALATDTADWFKFTPTSTGNYKLTIIHQTVNYTFNMYPSANNAAALVPTSSTSTSKQYALTSGLTYYVQIIGGLSFKCYDLSISSVASPAKYASTNTKVIAVEKLLVKAYPNPHKGLFNLSIISPEDGKAQIELFSILGQLLVKRDVLIEKGHNTIVEFNDVGRGIILYHLTIGNQEINGKVFGKD